MFKRFGKIYQNFCKHCLLISVLYNYFVSPTKLFSDLYVAKSSDTLAKSFFSMYLEIRGNLQFTFSHFNTKIKKITIFAMILARACFVVHLLTFHPRILSRKFG